MTTPESPLCPGREAHDPTQPYGCMVDGIIRAVNGTTDSPEAFATIVSEEVTQYGTMTALRCARCSLESVVARSRTTWVDGFVVSSDVTTPPPAEA